MRRLLYNYVNPLPGSDEVSEESWQLVTAIHDESNGLTLPTLVLHSILVMLVCVFAETDRTVAFKVLLWSVLSNLNLNLKRGIAFRWIRERSDTALLDVDGITLFFFTGHVISDSCEQGLHQILDHQVIKSTRTHGNYQLQAPARVSLILDVEHLKKFHVFLFHESSDFHTWNFVHKISSIKLHPFLHWKFMNGILDDF